MIENKLQEHKLMRKISKRFRRINWERFHIEDESIKQINKKNERYFTKTWRMNSKRQKDYHCKISASSISERKFHRMNEKRDTKMYHVRTIYFQHNKESDWDRFRSQFEELLLTSTITIWIKKIDSKLNNTRTIHYEKIDHFRERTTDEYLSFRKRKTIKKRVISLSFSSSSSSSFQSELESIRTIQFEALFQSLNQQQSSSLVQSRRYQSDQEFLKWALSEKQISSAKSSFWINSENHFSLHQFRSMNSRTINSNSINIFCSMNIIVRSMNIHFFHLDHILLLFKRKSFKRKHSHKIIS